MKCWLFSHGDGAWFAFGEDCVQAATALAPVVGVDDPEKFSVRAGPFNVEPGKPIDLASFWMFFTNDYNRSRRIL